VECFETGIKTSLKKVLAVIDVARSFQSLAAEKRQRFFFRVSIEVCVFFFSFYFFLVSFFIDL
jgi:hypothetical protein